MGIWHKVEEECIIENQAFHEQVARLVEGLEGRILILVKRVEHGLILNQYIPGSHFLSGVDTRADKRWLMQELCASEQPKVVAIVTDIAREGINVYVHHVINAAGGKSPAAIVQRVGRGLRLAPDKDQLHYHDFYFPKVAPIPRRHSKSRQATIKAQGLRITIK